MVLDANYYWKVLAREVLFYGMEQSPRGQETREFIGSQTRFEMTRPILTIPSRRLGYRFMTAEAWWILTGSNRVDKIESFSKRIASFSDDGYTFYGAYGPPVVEQLSYVINSIIKDNATRQAVLTIWRPRPGPSKDIPCTVSLQWLLRRGKDNQDRLHCIVNMRSSDVWLGVPYDVFNFSMISLFVGARLTAALGRPIQLGTLIFNAASQHIYERNVEDVNRCLDDEKVAFEYEPIEPIEFTDDPYRLVTHLHSVATGRPQDLKSPMLRGLAHDLRKIHRPDDLARKADHSFRPGWGDLGQQASNPKRLQVGGGYAGGLQLGQGVGGLDAESPPVTDSPSSTDT